MMTTTEPDASLLEAIAETLDRRLISHSRVSSQVSGDGVVVAVQVELEAQDGSRESPLLYVETSPRAEDRDGVLTMVDEETGDQVAVWAYPRDPELPALQAAVFPDGVAAILDRLGVAAGDDIRLELKAYRPGKRAVVRVDTARATVFLKVVRPGVAGELAQRHAAWIEAGLPVPQVLGWSDEGLLAISALGGVPATDAAERLDPVLFSSELIHLQQRIAGVQSSAPARPSLSSRLGWYERRLATAAPDLAQRVHRIARGIQDILDAAPAPQPVTVHGDLHGGQLFLDESLATVTGVLDIDTAGLGDPADDAAALYAHLIVTASINADRPGVVGGCEALATRWRATWERPADPTFASRTAAIAATHLLAHSLNQTLNAAALVDRARLLVENIRAL